MTTASEKRNPGVPLDLDWIESVRVDADAVEREAARLVSRAPFSPEERAEWLLRAVTWIDLTTLAADDTPETVRRLCVRARRPVPADLLAALGAGDRGGTTAAVCVHHVFIETALEALEGSAIPVAAVSAGFPSGLSPLPQRVDEIRASVAAGAAEIDGVITRAHVLTGDWRALHEELSAFRQAAGGSLMKVILSTSELGNLENVARASLVAMMAGADFIKTSTGMQGDNASLPAGLVMARAIREYRDRTGRIVGFKPAGGIRTAAAALDWIALVRAELGDAWLRAERFRIGASSLLDGILDELGDLADSRQGGETHAPAMSPTRSPTHRTMNRIQTTPRRGSNQEAHALPDSTRGLPRRGITRTRVRYAETDQMGVVYHANYLVWCEIGRTDLIRALGTSYAELERDGLTLAVAEASVRYHRPARYDDAIRIETWIERAQSRGVTFGYEILRESDDESVRLATAMTKLIALDDRGAPRTFPPEILGAFRDAVAKD